MAIPKFRDPLPEDRLSEKERDERICILDQFSKKLKKEMRTAALDDKAAIRQLLLYVGMRLDLLDLENRHARGLKRFDFLLGHTTKPVPQGLIGVAADAALDLGLKDTESMIRSHEARTVGLIAEISLIAPEINRLLDQRRADDRDNFVLLPSSCLPEAVSIDQDAPSKSEDTPELPNSDEPQTYIVSEAQMGGDLNAKTDDLGNAAPSEIRLAKDRSPSPNGKAPKTNLKSGISDEELRKEWLDSKKPRIEVCGQSYRWHFEADRIKKLDYLTVRQRVAAVLRFGYEMNDVAIGKLMHIEPKTVYGHHHAALSKMKNDPSMMHLLNKFKRKSRRFNDEEDTSGSE